MTTIHAERQGKADLHVHTTWSDGAQRPEAVVAAASGRVDVLAITDHDEIGGALAARAYARRQPDLGVDVIVGEEISTLNGHLIGLFLEARVPPGLTALRTIELIRGQGNNAGVFSWLYDAWAALRNTEWMLPVCGGSDAHHVWYVGRGVTRFDGRNAAALRLALTTGRTRAHRAWSWTAGKLPRHVHYQSRCLIKFLRLSAQRRAL